MIALIWVRSGPSWSTLPEPGPQASPNEAVSVQGWERRGTERKGEKERKGPRAQPSLLVDLASSSDCFKPDTLPSACSLPSHRYRSINTIIWSPPASSITMDTIAWAARFLLLLGMLIQTGKLWFCFLLSIIFAFVLYVITIEPVWCPYMLCQGTVDESLCVMNGGTHPWITLPSVPRCQQDLLVSLNPHGTPSGL